MNEVNYLYAKRAAPQHCFEVLFPNCEECGEWRPQTEIPVFPPVKQIPGLRKYIRYLLSADDEKNEWVLREAATTLNTMKLRRDTVHGLLVMLDDHT